MVKYAVPYMVKNKPVNDKGERGVLIFVSSVAADEGQRGQLAYSASKGAINGMMMPMARDLGKYGIRCAAIAPAVFLTPMVEAMNENVKKRLFQDTPLNRGGDPKEFAHFAGAIIENSFINGVALRLDGATKMSHL